MLFTLLVVPVVLYLEYVYSLKALHVKKIAIIINRYYTFADIITYLCLAKINPHTGKLLSNYIQYNASIMWAVDNFTNFREGLTELCEKIYGYSPGSELLQSCVQQLTPLAELCEEIDDDYPWFIMDRYGTVFFVSRALRQQLHFRTRIEKRLFLAYFMNYYFYGNITGASNRTYQQFARFMRQHDYIILVPFGGVIQSKEPVIFVNMSFRRALQKLRGIRAVFPVGALPNTVAYWRYNDSYPHAELVWNNTYVSVPSRQFSRAQAYYVVVLSWLSYQNISNLVAQVESITGA